MGKKVTIPADLREKLAAAKGGVVALCDAAGEVIGYAVTPTWLARMEEDSRWLSKLDEPGQVDGPHIMDEAPGTSG